MKVFHSVVLALLCLSSFFVAHATRDPSRTSKLEEINPNVETHPAHRVPTDTLEPTVVEVFKIRLIHEKIAQPQQEEVLNSSKTFLASTFYDEKEKAHRIFFKQLKTGKLYEIEEKSLKYRPFTDLFWKDDSTLIFDRWSNPHFGYHYEVDVMHLKLKVAAAFPD